MLWYVLRVHCIGGTTIFHLLFLEHANVTVGGRKKGPLSSCHRRDVSQRNDVVTATGDGV